MTSVLPPHLAADSAATWRDDRTPEPAVPDALRPPVGADPVTRLRALRTRHRLRAERAQEYLRHTMHSGAGLPIADSATANRFIGGLLRTRVWLVVGVVLTNALAAVAGLAVPRMLGAFVDDTGAKLAQGLGAQAWAAAPGFAALVLGVVVLQTLLTVAAKASAAVLGQDVLASAREDVVRSVLRVPLSRIESAGTGDLVTRVTRDVSSMSQTVRWAIPEMIVAGTTVVLTLVALAVNSLPLALPAYVLFGIATVQIVRYLRAAPAAYITESGTYSRINTTLTETVEGARTVEALRLTGLRHRASRDDLEVSAQAERYTLSLRNLLFMVMDLAFSLPRAATLAVGAVGYGQGWASIGQITAAMLYIEAVWGPFDRLVQTLDMIQVGQAATSRLVGISTIPPDRVAGDELPDGPHLVGRDLRFAYREGHDVLHGVDLDLRVGERLAMVGPSGSGKSTLGRLLAGLNVPRTGSATVGGVELTRLPLPVLRREVALVTQEHHVFIGTIRDNVALAREDAHAQGEGDGEDVDAAVRRALAAVEALDWVDALPDGLDTTVGSGHQPLTPGQAQQIALARLVLADPHTLVLDEATSLIDPGTARHLEGSMNALLTGRTVVAIAHRLHTAHDADRIAVVVDGRIAELGSHDELLAADGEYAALWRAWTS